MDNLIDLGIKKAQIKNQTCFASLNDEETEVLATLLVKKEFAPGQTIVTEGDPVDSVYFLLSGSAEVVHISIHENKPVITTVTNLAAGQTIGLNETGFYSLSGIRTATVIAKTAVVALRLSVAAFHGFALVYPHVNEVMHKNAESFLRNEEL